MTGLDELFEGNPAVARWALGLFVRDLTVRARRNGLVIPLAVKPVLTRLAEIADLPIPTSSASGTGFGSVAPEVDSLFVSTRQAADRFGKSDSYVRRLAQAGRIRACRVGRDWRVDPISLDNVLRRTL